MLRRLLWIPLAPPLLLLAGTALAQGGVLSYCHQPDSEPPYKQIHVVNADGTGEAILTSITSPAGINYPDWSPDATRIAVGGYVSGTTWSIYRLEADGSNLTQLTTTPDVWDSEPDWSPDGSRILFARRIPPDHSYAEIWVMNADGSDQQFTGVTGSAPNWSPDGSRIAFQRLDGAVYQINVCDADGTNTTPLTETTSHEMFPAWSPDGNRIAFMSTRDGNREIYVMNADGTQPRRLTVDDAGDDCPAWSPDGSLIAWDSDREGGTDHWEIYLMNADGSDQVRVTYTPAGATAINPDWMPQDHAYLGQDRPGLVPIRFPPDSLCAGSEWFWHGAPMFSPDLRELYWSKYTIHPTYDRTELACLRLERNQWTPLQSPSFADLDYDENNPFFWAGNDTLYFRSNRPGGYIFRVSRTQRGWSAPAPVPIPIPPGLSMGNQFALAGNGDLYLEFWDGPDADLYVSRFVGGSYQAAEPLVIANTPGYEWSPYIDPGLRFLLFASNRPGGYGMNDLYICTRGAGGTWQAPVNLGGVINGSDEDAFPCISPDGLYFFYQTQRVGDLGYNPYWVDAQIIYDLLPDETATVLQQMTATYRENAIRIAWQLSTLEAGATFTVLRAEPPHEEYRTLADLRIERDGLAFTVTDAGIEPGSSYRYRVEYEVAGHSRMLFETETIATPVASLALYQNLPNPFNPTTLIRYYLPEPGRVVLDIYDVSGRRIVRLIDGKQEQGQHGLTWDGRDGAGCSVSSGTYFYLLRTHRATLTRRMTLLR